MTPFAMHLPDGHLSPGVAAVAALLAVAGAAGVRGPVADPRRFAAVTAFVFAAQMLNFPVADGTSGHLIGAALAVALLGPRRACLSLTIVLAVQALVLADGGLAVLGANVLNMGVLGALLAGALLPRLPLGLVAWLCVMASATATSVELALSGTVPLGTVLPAMLEIHALIGIGEALITVAVVGLARQPARVTVRLAALAVAAVLAVPLASGAPDGLERVALEQGF